MTLSNKEIAYEVTWLVRRLFRALADAADEYLAESGLSAADRAVLEFLYPKQQLSVPQIARRYKVSRQHVQVTVNRLLQGGLVQSENNPRHKRSPLMRLSRLGRETFARIRDEEDALLSHLFSELPEADVNTSCRTLRSLYARLTKEPDHESI